MKLVFHVYRKHIARNAYVERQECAIAPNGENNSNGNKTNKPIRAGVAIAIKTKCKDNIIQIAIQSRRSMELGIKTDGGFQTELY